MERGKKRTYKGDFWWEIRPCDYYDKFIEAKIMYQTFQVKPCFVYDESKMYCNNSMWIIPSENKALVGILNSKMGWWLISKYCTQIHNGCKLIWKYFGEIPIADTSDELDNLVSTMLVFKHNLEKISNKFTKYFSGQFHIEKLTKKLENWYESLFANFIKELNKAIKTFGGTPLTKKDEIGWM